MTMRHINYVPSMRTVRGVWYLVAVGLVALIGWLIWSVVNAETNLERTNARLDRAEQDRRSLAQIASENQATAEVLAEQLRELGERPLVDPTSLPQVIPGPPGPTGLPGPRGPGPTATEVQRAVDAYCAGGRCDGRDGQDVTPNQVAAAVGAYCNARGECRGAVGPMGPTGPPGAAGKDAPPPTQEQVNQAVANYCADGRCRGPKGDRGEPGQSAFPFTFAWEYQINPAQTYRTTCTITSPTAFDCATERVD